MRDALKNYLAMAGGYGEIGKRRALAASRALVAQGEATAEQVSQLAEDLVRSTRENRAAVTALVRAEVDRALARLGLATADEVRKLADRLEDVEGSLREIAGGSAAGGAAKPRAAKAPAAKPAKAPAARKATKATARKAAP